MRGFARYRSALIRERSSALALLPFKPKRARPYLFQMGTPQLLRAALRMPYRLSAGKLRPWVYYCLLAC